MHAFKQQNHCKKALGNLATFSFLLVIFMNSEGCASKPLGKNFEQLTEMIRIADPMEIRSASRNQWKEVHQHPLFQRYHGLGADFSARGYPFHSSDTSDEETYPVMEKKPEVDWVDVENILRLLNGYHDGRQRRKRFFR